MLDTYSLRLRDHDQLPSFDCRFGRLLYDDDVYSDPDRLFSLRHRLRDEHSSNLPDAASRD